MCQRLQEINIRCWSSKGKKEMKVEVKKKYIIVKEIEERLNMWSLSASYYYGSKNTSQNRTWTEEGSQMGEGN